MTRLFDGFVALEMVVLGILELSLCFLIFYIIFLPGDMALPAQGLLGLHPTTVRHAAIRTYGDTIHSFYAFRDYTGPFLPGYAEREIAGQGVGILRVDHMVGNVELGRMDHWAQWYSDVLGFSRYISFDDTVILSFT